MDIHKLEVDDSQINKATGRIILPDKETSAPSRSHSTHPRSPAPRIIARPAVASASSAGSVGTNASGHAVPSIAGSPPPTNPMMHPAASSDSSGSIPSAPWWSILAVGVLLALGVFLLGSMWWSHGQLSQSLESLRMETIRGQAQLEKTGQALHDATRDLGDLRVVLSEMRSEVRAELQGQTTRLRSLQEQMAELETEPAFIAPPQMTPPASNFSSPSSPSTIDNSQAP